MLETMHRDFIQHCIRCTLFWSGPSLHELLCRCTDANRWIFPSLLCWEWSASRTWSHATNTQLHPFLMFLQFWQKKLNLNCCRITWDISAVSIQSCHARERNIRLQSCAGLNWTFQTHAYRVQSHTEATVTVNKCVVNLWCRPHAQLSLLFKSTMEVWLPLLKMTIFKNNASYKGRYQCRRQLIRVVLAM